MNLTLLGSPPSALTAALPINCNKPLSAFTLTVLPSRSLGDVMPLAGPAWIMVTSAPLTPVEPEPAAMIFSGRPLSRACSTLTSAVKPKWYSPLITAGTAPVEAMNGLVHGGAVVPDPDLVFLPAVAAGVFDAVVPLGEHRFRKVSQDLLHGLLLVRVHHGLQPLPGIPQALTGPHAAPAGHGPRTSPCIPRGGCLASARRC